jgi:ABC-type transport system involved in Fe-S cluster assembly fused permease/ATPase subunit
MKNLADLLKIEPSVKDAPGCAPLRLGAAPGAPRVEFRAVGFNYGDAGDVLEKQNAEVRLAVEAQCTAVLRTPALPVAPCSMRCVRARS